LSKAFGMSANDIKKELISYIENIKDERLLSLLKEDIVFYGSVKDGDITDNLDEEQLKELKALSEEDNLKDTMSMDEYKKATEQWRTK
jgi:hypothetical protein